MRASSLILVDPKKNKALVPPYLAHSSHIKTTPGTQVVAKGENGEAAANLIARQCALLRGAHPVLALPSCTGPMATDGTMTDWGIRTVRS